MVLQSGQVFPTSDHCKMQRKQKECTERVKAWGSGVVSVAYLASRIKPILIASTASAMYYSTVQYISCVSARKDMKASIHESSVFELFQTNGTGLLAGSCVSGSFLMVFIGHFLFGAHHQNMFWSPDYI